jgi:hypothetical protein
MVQGPGAVLAARQGLVRSLEEALMAHIVPRIACATALIVTTAVATAVPALAQEPPVIERIQVEETFPDDFLTEECGVPVTTTVRGAFTTISFPGEGTGSTELRTVNLGFTATAGDNTVRFRDVGADLLRVEPDGTAVLSIIGQIPFDFTGVLKIDLETGEVILEPQHFGDVADVCAALTA